MSIENGNSGLSAMVQRAIDGDTDSENALAQLFLEQALAVLPRKSSGHITPEDQEDIAISAVKSFCLGIRKGKIEYQGDKQLYGLLHEIIDGKIRKLWQYHFALKRNIKQSESLGSPDSKQDARKPVESDRQRLLLADPIDVTPEEQEAVDRILEDLQLELRGLFSLLVNELDEHPRRLLLTMLETDANNVQLSKLIGRSVASVERYRQVIRKKIEIFGATSD